MNYSQALDISRRLARAKTKAAGYLRAMCRKTGRQPTFIIMRYGDPRGWRRLPQPQDARRLRSLKYSPYYTGSGKRVLSRSKYTRLRACELENLKGRVITAASIAEFCDKARLGIIDRFHVTPVLNGDRPSFKGWFLPAYLAREVELRDIYGNLTKHTVCQLIVDHKMGTGSINRLLRGEAKSISSSRLMLAETPIDPAVKPRDTRITKVKLTDGRRVFTGKSIPEAMRQAGMTDFTGTYQMAYGFRDKVQGMRLKSIEVEKKRVLAL